MHRAVVTAILAALIVVGAATAACGLSGGGGTKVVIPADYHTADATYTLLYSTIGYESAATKRVLIRQNDTTAPASQGFAFAWPLIDAKGSEAAVGRAVYAGTGWGIPVWSADFSKVTKAGAYRIVIEAPSVKLATDGDDRRGRVAGDAADHGGSDERRGSTAHVRWRERPCARRVSVAVGRTLRAHAG